MDYYLMYMSLNLRQAGVTYWLSQVWRYWGGIAADIIWFYMPILSKSLCHIYFKLLVTTLFCQTFVNRLFFLLVVVMLCTLIFALSTCHTKTSCLPHVISVVPYNSESPSYNCLQCVRLYRWCSGFFMGPCRLWSVRCEWWCGVARFL